MAQLPRKSANNDACAPRPRRGKMMALAGLLETWRSPATYVRSFAIFTTEPNELCAALHNRMPAILAPEAWPGMARRGTGARGAAEIAAGPLPFDATICWPVSARVGNVRNNNSSLIEPIAAVG